jgi:aminoglycoside 2'-N-acetyltransferase I
MLEAAYGGDRFSDEDWEHCLGGVHVLGELDGDLVAHAAVVERRLHSGGRALRTGYVEGVAVRGDLRRRGLASEIMREVNDVVGAEGFELGALGDGSGVVGFYRRLGWRAWQGPTEVITPDGPRRTEDEDGFILVLFTVKTPELDVTQPLACEARSGDDW